MDKLILAYKNVSFIIIFLSVQFLGEGL